MRSLLLSLPAGLAALLVLGCSSSDEPTPAGPITVTPHPDPDPLAPLSDVALTTDEVITPTHTPEVSLLDPSIVADMEAMLSQGFGDFDLAGGWVVETRTLDDAAPPSPGPNPVLLARFVHLADTQLADDESPARLASVDLQGTISGAFRPQEGHECRILNAAVRTINAVDQAQPLDFVILGGDNADNAQTNEVTWFSAILDGNPRVECDSGADNDPTAGPANDLKDPFFADGLAVPWLWVTGNHDILGQGNFPVAQKTAEAVGDYAATGTRDWSQPGGPVAEGPVVPDENRRMLSRTDLLALVAQTGDGHGLDDTALQTGKAYYAWDVEGTPLRMIAVDTAAETGGAEGVVHEADIESLLRPLLDDAVAEDKLVILVSHHVSGQLSDGGSLGGEVQADAVTSEAFQALLGGYDNVIMHLGGHTHVHRVTKIEPAGGTSYWELQTAALADFPNQMRLIEVTDQDNGFISIRAVGIDYATDGDDVAADGRRRAIADMTSGWQEDGTGELMDRNVELWVPLPIVPPAP